MGRLSVDKSACRQTEIEAVLYQSALKTKWFIGKLNVWKHGCSYAESRETSLEAT